MKPELKKQVKEIALQELKKGKKPEEVFNDAISAGAKKEEIVAIMEEFMNENLPVAFIPLIKDFLRKKTDLYKKEQKISSEKSKIWDPIDEDVRPALFERDLNELNKKYNAYKKHPNSIRFIFFLSLIPLIALVPMVLYGINNDFNFFDKQDRGWLFLLLIPFIPSVCYKQRISATQKDLAKLMIAKENNWTYSPKEKLSRWKLFKKKFPEIFNAGTKNRSIQDEFWGIFRHGTQKRFFYMSTFTFVSDLTMVRSLITREKVYQEIFIIKLDKKLRSDFRLESRYNFYKERPKEIETESAFLSDRFDIFYNGKRADKELDIFMTLSPSVQVRIIQIIKRQKPTVIQFKEDMVLFAFKPTESDYMKTNFLRKVKVDQRDVNKIKKRFDDMLNIASEIIPFLD